MPRRFVKSHDTKASAVNSRGALEKMLRRYGASGFSVSQDYARGVIVASFIVPNTPEKNAQSVPVQLPVRVHDVYDALYGRPMRSIYPANADERALPPFNGRSWVSVHNEKGYETKKMEQAERVAWRNLLLWVDAALSAAGAGLQTISEAFFAHALIETPRGRVRLSDYLDSVQGELAPGVRALLTAPADEVSHD